MRCYICNYAPHVMKRDHEYIRGPEMYIDEHTGKDICHKCHNMIQDTIVEDQIKDLLGEDYELSSDMGASVQDLQDTEGEATVSPS